MICWMHSRRPSMLYGAAGGRPPSPFVSGRWRIGAWAQSARRGIVVTQVAWFRTLAECHVWRRVNKGDGGKEVR